MFNFKKSLKSPFLNTLQIRDITKGLNLGIIPDFESSATSAQGDQPWRHLRLCLRYIGSRGSPSASPSSLPSLQCIEGPAVSHEVITDFTYDSTSATTTTSTTCEASLMNTTQEGLGVYWRTSPS